MGLSQSLLGVMGLTCDRLVFQVRTQVHITGGRFTLVQTAC